MSHRRDQFGTVFNEEVQIDHALQLMRPVLQGKAAAFEVKESVFTRYNEWLQKRLVKSVWAHCRSYYRGRTEDGRNYAIFPGRFFLCMEGTG